MKSILLVVFLSFFSIRTFAQASWDYHFDFALCDKNGRTITADDVNSGKVRVFISQWRPTLSYNHHLKLFSAEGSATNTGVAIGLIQGHDTTIVHLAGSDKLVLTNWPKEPGIYSLNIREHSNAFKLSPNSKAVTIRDVIYSLTVLDWQKCVLAPEYARLSWPFQEQDTLRISNR